MTMIAGIGSSGWARETRAQIMPTKAKLAATDKSMPRVRMTTICASVSMNRKLVSVSTPTRLSGVTKTGARKPMATISAKTMRASAESR